MRHIIKMALRIYITHTPTKVGGIIHARTHFFWCASKTENDCFVLSFTYLKPANADLRRRAPPHALAKRAHGDAAEGSFHKDIVSALVPHLQVSPPSVTRHGVGGFDTRRQARERRVTKGGVGQIY